MGKEFVEPPSLDLSVCFKDSSCVTPLIFVLSAGCDPFASFSRFAKEVGMDGSYEQVSLG